MVAQSVQLSTVATNEMDERYSSVGLMGSQQPLHLIHLIVIVQERLIW